MEVVSLLVQKVVDYLFDVVKQEISHMWNASENVENLKNEVEKISGMKGRIQQQIDLAKSKGELLLEGVEEWMNEADVKICEAKEFIAQDAEAKKTCFCVNLSTHSRYSKMATKKTCILLQHQRDGKNFETGVSLPPPTPRFTDVYQRKNLENIHTQMSILNKIIEAIEDDKIQIVGISGLGGVGKTTLASEVAAKLKNQFADIVFITVSQTIDAVMIEEKVKIAARRIIRGEKVLIILDDLWEELRLDKVGIPCGDDKMNCKILITSRNKDVCEAMNGQRNISVNPLQEEEAWTLFERVVGRTAWDVELKKVAMNIVKECGGLPLFIQAVGKTLKNKEIKSWEAALHQLQNPIDEDASCKRKGLMQLKLSYNYLESEVAKSCFLLCSVFQEDGTIGLKRLTYYGLCLGIFGNQDSNIQDAKYRVQLAVDSLKSSFLLLSERRDERQEEEEEEEEEDEDKEEDEETFKMHDLVRDMAILITSEGNEKFWVQSGKGLRVWKPERQLESYKKISLMGNNIRKLPDHELLFPNLDTFLIQDNELSNIHDKFFGGMEKLKVLDMSSNEISSLPQSLKQLTILRMLDLSRNRNLREISILGELKCLEILKLRSTGITKIPEEISQLTKLRLLDVYYCKDLSYVTPGVISKLICLEALYVQLEGDCNFLVELQELKLKILHLRLPELHSIPKIETLREFDIGKTYEWRTSYRRCKRRLRISKSSFPFNIPVMKLIQQSEMLTLCDIKALRNILPDLYPHRLDELKYIDLVKCDNLTTLAKTHAEDAMQTFVTSDGIGQGRFFSQVREIVLISLNSLEILWDSPHQFTSFCNLVYVNIEDCPSLLKLFPISVAQGLAKLKELHISECENLVVVISAGDEQTAGSEIEETYRSSEIELAGTDIVFSLTHINLYKLPKLESFYSGHEVIKYPSLKSIYVEECPSMKTWSYGDDHETQYGFQSSRETA